MVFVPIIVCMNTGQNPNNERLKELVQAAGLTQAAALERFNVGLGARPLSASTWKGYFCDHTTTRFRGLSDSLLQHAEKVFGSVKVNTAKATKATKVSKVSKAAAKNA